MMRKQGRGMEELSCREDERLGERSKDGDNAGVKTSTRIDRRLDRGRDGFGTCKGIEGCTETNSM